MVQTAQRVVLCICHKEKAEKVYCSQWWSGGMNTTKDVFCAQQFTDGSEELQQVRDGMKKRFGVMYHIVQERLVHVCEQRVVIPVEEIERVVSEVGDIGMPHLLGRNRKPRVVARRQVLYYLVYEYTSMSYTEIAARYNRTDHTTIMWGANKVRDLLEIGDETITNLVARMKVLL